MIVAIDGPAGAGKSSVAKTVAKRLGFHYLDTGAMYRACAQRALALEVSLDNEDAVAAIAQNDLIEFRYRTGEPLPTVVFIAGEDVTHAIRTPEVDAAVSKVAAMPKVRQAMVAQQRAVATQGDCVVEGRDIGTAVFPDAELKVFITAAPEIRAARRARQNVDRNVGSTYDEVYLSMLKRDAADSTREVAPLAMADDAILVDTSHMPFDQVVDYVLELVRERR